MLGFEQSWPVPDYSGASSYGAFYAEAAELSAAFLSAVTT